VSSKIGSVLLSIGIATTVGCKQLGCDSNESLTGPRLTYDVVGIDAALDQQLRVHGRRLQESIEARDSDADIEVEYHDALVVRTSSEQEADRVEKVVEESHPGLESVEGDGEALRYTITDRSAESYRGLLVAETVRSINGRLIDAGLEQTRAIQVGATGIEVAMPDEPDIEPERVREIVENAQRLRFSTVDDERADYYFPSLEGDLPEEAKLCSVQGHPSVVHEGRREARETLEEFFDGRRPDDRTIGYEFVPKKSSEEKPTNYDDQPSSIMDLDEEPTEKDPCAFDFTQWRTYVLEPEALLEHDDILDAQVATDEQTSTPVVDIFFTDEGAERLEQVTREHVDRRLALVVGQTVESAVMVREPIPDGAMRFSPGRLQGYEEQFDETRKLAHLLRAQSAPIELEFQGMEDDEGVSSVGVRESDEGGT